jgi:ribosomal-protein-alanine N-acetyltransferase
MEDVLRHMVRPMRLEDVRQANEIDRECFPTQWPPPSFKRELLFNRLAHYLVAGEEETHPAEPVEKTEQNRPRPSHLLRRVRRFLFAEGASDSTIQRIVGLVGFWIMAGEAHITTIGVREAYLRLGIGELLLISAVELAMKRNAQVITLEVRASNSAAIALYEKYGFSRTGVRRGYYTDNREDAVTMTTDTITSAPFQSRFQRLKQAHAERWGPAQCQID